MLDPLIPQLSQSPLSVNPSEVLYATIHEAIQKAIALAVEASRPLTKDDMYMAEKAVMQAIAIKKDLLFRQGIAYLEAKVKRLQDAVNGYKPSTYESGLLTGDIPWR